MREKDFLPGTVLSTEAQIFVKEDSGEWSVFRLEEPDPPYNMDKLLREFPSIFEVLVTPSGLEVLEGLPSGSVVVSGKDDFAFKAEEGDWKIGGMEGWFDSSAVEEILGRFEVVSRGDEE